ncbi:MAG: hypothetical protein M1839_001515 [Geoglossum umbratile]|nr:MAG: hypothetical protein M1839_001515 [Geoglossum umbratile]
MSLARAFTSRRNKRGDSTPTPALPGRASTTKRTSGVPISRRKISAPIALISTTNMLSYNAPNIRSSSSSSSSASDSDSSPLSHSPATSVSLDSPPRSPVGTNHLSIYFPPSGRLDSQSEEAPPVPQRALSHTRNSHILAHRRSQKRASPPNTVGNAITETSLARSTSSASAASVDQLTHPFGKELEQVNELVEEITENGAFEKEELMMQEKGLMKFLAEDYAMEIQDLFGGVFEDQLPVLGAGWI